MALCQNILSRIRNRSVKRDPLRHQVTLTVPGNYSAAVCPRFSRLPSFTQLYWRSMTRDCCCWSASDYLLPSYFAASLVNRERWICRKWRT